MLCRSLLKMPKILLLDNPFAGLDVHSRDVLRSALQQLKEAGVLVIFVTSTSEIPDSVTHILELEHGKIKSQKLHNQNHESSEKQEIKATETRLPQLQSSSTLNLQSLAFEYAVNLRNINVTYGSQKVLDHVNWKVKKGEKWALVGPNGSGKSTLLSILTADNPQRFANDYDLFDQKRGGASMWDVKSKIGHVSPELHLYFPQETTVFKTIASGFFDATGIYFRKLTEQQIQQTHLVAEWLQVADLLEKLLKIFLKVNSDWCCWREHWSKIPPFLF